MRLRTKETIGASFFQGQSEFAEYEWMVEDGADEKLQREVEEQLKYAELERMVMQLEDESGDMQVNKFQ